MNANQPIDLPAPNDTIRIRGKDIPIVTTFLDHKVLRFFVENPRVYSILRLDGSEPTQEDIERKLLDMDHVKALVQDIKRDGGLTEAVIVRDGTFEVLEGNSRLAAYRALAKTDPVKWAQMKCRLLPRNVEESLVFALLGQYHIKGKKDWAPFEQAGFLYRRSRMHNVSSDILAQEIGLTKSKVDHLIDTYQFMLDHGEADVRRWSYYDEYLKSSKIRKARLANAGLDKLIVEKVRSEEISRAEDIRDRLPVICSAPRSLQKFVRKDYDFEEAHEHAVEGGADNAALKKVAAFRQWLAKPEVFKELAAYQGETKHKIEFELGKIETRLKAIMPKLKTGA